MTEDACFIEAGEGETVGLERNKPIHTSVCQKPVVGNVYRRLTHWGTNACVSLVPNGRPPCQSHTFPCLHPLSSIMNPLPSLFDQHTVLSGFHGFYTKKEHRRQQFLPQSLPATRRHLVHFKTQAHQGKNALSHAAPPRAALTDHRISRTVPNHHAHAKY